jgi:rare lipoprotein A (peptidoglycan hydrolase)
MGDGSLRIGQLIAMASCGLALAGAARADELPAPVAHNPLQALMKDLAAGPAVAQAKTAVADAPAPRTETIAARPAATRHARTDRARSKSSAPAPKAELAAAIANDMTASIETAQPNGDAQLVRASWYGGGERLSAHTANGDVFRPMALTAAHRTLPFGTMLRVTSPLTGLSTIVRVNDRGPAASTGYAIDLSRGAATALGIVNKGEQKVTIEVMR